MLIISSTRRKFIQSDEVKRLFPIITFHNWRTKLSVSNEGWSDRYLLHATWPTENRMAGSWCLL